MTVHATSVAVGPAAVLLRGPSGSGKSDLALRLISTAALAAGGDRTCQLIADDQTVLRLNSGRLMASAPSTLAGKLEVRGVGIIDVPWRNDVEVRLVIDLTSGEHIERFPLSDETANLLGQAISRRRLAPFEPSAPLKVLLLLRALSAT